jgi:outer membrane protein TolC
LNVNQSRADDLDREFLDGVVTINKNIYDFGVVEYKKNAEVLRKEALKLEYQQVFSTTLQKLLNIVNDVARVKTVLVKLRSDLVKTKASIDEVKLRFTSGIGTVMDVRQAQLSLLDLETEIQTLRRDRDTNLVILRDEFSLSQSDLKLINSAINQFNNKLTANKQDVALVINQLINYQRSVDIINLEKSALNSQIKSLKSENMPQLSASVTGIAYDVTRGLDEYELYGGINLAMPLFDSGLSKVKQRGLTYRIKVQNDMMNALNQDKSLALNKLIKKYKNIQIENNNAVQKQANLTEKLSQIIQRMAVVDEGLLSKLQTQLQLAKIKRDLLAYPYHIKSINIDYWSLNEQLIEKIGIHPTK